MISVDGSRQLFLDRRDCGLWSPSFTVTTRSLAGDGRDRLGKANYRKPEEHSRGKQACLTGAKFLVRDRNIHMDRNTCLEYGAGWFWLLLSWDVNSWKRANITKSCRIQGLIAIEW